MTRTILAITVVVRLVPKAFKAKMIGTIIRVATMVHESVHDKQRKREQRRIETPALNDEGARGPFALELT